MSKKYLADEIDIHAGGEDLIFPHHENEIAQSEAANGVPFSKYWMHNAFLNIDNKKMSKSLGNFFTVRDISREYDLEVLRFFMLSAHYRNPVNFSHDLMESAKNGLDRILTAVDNLRHLSENAKDVPMTEDEKKIITSIDDIYKKFEDSMDDDFNTADAISAIFELVKLANSNSSSDNSKEYIDTLMKKITTLTDILGLKTDKKEEMLDEDIEALIAERQQARKDKNFARADEIRDELLTKGIVLKDTREGVRMEQSLDNDLVKCIYEGLDMKHTEPSQLSPLVLAYIGDSIYDLVIKTWVIEQGNMQVNKLNKKTSSIVKAESQSAMIGVIEPMLSEHEEAVYKRGRNAKSYTSAKNASIGDYRRATGFEALMGYLYLSGQYERMMELVKAGLESLELK